MADVTTTKADGTKDNNTWGIIGDIFKNITGAVKDVAPIFVGEKSQGTPTYIRDANGNIQGYVRLPDGSMVSIGASNNNGFNMNSLIPIILIGGIVLLIARK